MGSDDTEPASTPDDPGSDPLAPPPITPAPGPAPTAPPAVTEITIKTTEPYKLVAYREVSDPVWHLATEVTTGLFTASVHGPYWVTAVCQAPQIGAPQLFTQVYRAGRTLDDNHEIDPPFLCAPTAPLPLPEVTGSLAQANAEVATVALSGSAGSGSFANSAQQFPFSLLVPTGTYTMYGFNGEQIEIRPDVVVDQSLPVFPFDLSLDATAYVPASLVAANADPAAFVHAVTRIEDADGTLPFSLADRPIAAAIAVPNEAMTTDNQTVSVQTSLTSSADNVVRSENLASRRPWRLGDDPTFVEPPQFTRGAWAFDGFGHLFASWQALPPSLADLSNEVAGTSVFGDFVDDFTEMTPAFIAATHPTRIVVDTSIPGFQLDWIVDYHSATSFYSRRLIGQVVANAAQPEQGQISTSNITETVGPTGQVASRAAVDALPATPRMARRPGTAPFAP